MPTDDMSAEDLKAAYALIYEAHKTGIQKGRAAFADLIGYYPDIFTYSALIKRARKDAGEL